MENESERSLRLPVESCAVAVRTLSPSARRTFAMENAPSNSVISVTPTGDEFTRRATVTGNAPARLGTRPVTVKFDWFVDAGKAAKFGGCGGSKTTSKLQVAKLTFPDKSVTCTPISFVPVDNRFAPVFNDRSKDATLLASPSPMERSREFNSNGSNDAPPPPRVRSREFSSRGSNENPPRAPCMTISRMRRR